MWREFVARLDDGARAIDLAAGAGAAARACIEAATALGKAIVIDAVDAADISLPPLERAAQRLRFHGAARLEQLPFPPASFDAALSQFGFEYANEEQAAAEVARVLRPGGQLRLVMHARSGAISADIGARVERLRAALEDNGPITLARALARTHQTGDVAARQRAETKLPAAIELLRAWSRTAPPDDAALFYGKAMLEDWLRRERYQPADLRRAIEAGWASAHAVALRQEGLLHAARSEDDVAALARRFSTLGLTTSPAAPVHDARGEQIAWLLDAQRG